VSATFAAVGQIAFPAVVGAREQIRLAVVVTSHDGSVAVSLHDGVRHLSDVRATKHCTTSGGPPARCIDGISSGAARGGGRKAPPLWVDVQKLCNVCVLSLSWNFFVSHDKCIARPSSKEPR